MKYYFTLAIILVTLSLTLYGCNKNSNSPESEYSDSQQITDLTTNEYADYFTFDDFAEGGSVGNVPAPDGLDSAITPTRWGRVERSESLTRTVTADSTTPDTVRVTVTRTVQGIMRIQYGSTPTTIEKPYRDVYRRHAVFVRTGHTRYRHLNWRLVRISGIEGHTENSTSVNISSVAWYRKALGGASWEQIGTTVTDPLTYWQQRDALPVYRAGDSLKVVVTMNDSGPYYGQLHYKPWRAVALHRAPFHLVGSIAWEIVGQIPSEVNNSAKRRLFIDFMTEGTLFDSGAPYSAACWGLLYAVI